MRTALCAGAAAAAALLVPAPAAEGAGTARPRVALSASPARVAVVGASSRRIELRNAGAASVVVDASRAALGRRTARAWLTLVPRRLTLRPGRRAFLTVRVAPPRRAEPGDHHALVLLTTRPQRGARVAVRMRLGILVRARVPGRIVRRLELRGLRVQRGRVLAVVIANRGNVTERTRVRISLRRRGRVLVVLRPRDRNVLPGTRAVVETRYRGRIRGPVTAVVGIHGAPERRFRIRL